MLGCGTGSRQGSRGPGALTSAVPASHEQPLDRLVMGAPLVLVALIATEEVEACPPGRDGSLDDRVDQEHARGQIARVGVDPGVVVEEGVRRLEVDARRDAPPTDRQEGEPELSIGAMELEEPPDEDAALFASERVGEEAVRAPFLL